jgi:MarR family multiple antibiotic resistance transcriptional regulator
VSEPRRRRYDNVLLQMFRTSLAVRELMLIAVEGTGITSAQYAVLGTIAAFRSISPTELAARLRVPPTSISRHVAELVAAGLAVRAPNPSDRRSYLLELTDDGRKVVRTIVPRIRRLLAELREHAEIEEIEEALVELERAARAVALEAPTRR